MIGRIIMLIPIIVPLVSCSLVFVSPIKKDVKTRIGEFPTKGIPLRSPATICWNEYQVPYIKAENDHDCAYLLGIVHAHLRLGQMSIMREAANCRLAQHVGPLAVKFEQTLRTMDLTCAVDSIYTNLPQETKDWLHDYCEGINLYQHRMSQMPVEMRMLKIKPEPWTVGDILKIGRLISTDVNWINYFSMLKLTDNPEWNDYWSLLLEKGGGTISSDGSNALNPQNWLNNETKSGSNAYTIAPENTAMGSAIMASDPHLGLQLPNFWLIAGYECPSYHVLGLMFPGIPIVMVGRNEQIAFSGTNMRSASSDLFELSPEQTGTLKTTKVKIKVRGWLDKSISIRHSSLGPVVSDAPYLKNGHNTYALNWVGHQASDEMTALLKVNRAQDWQSFKSAFDTYAVSGQNYLFADKAGHIGLVPAVKIPIRHYSKPSTLILPYNEQTKWQGYENTQILPSIFDPPSGYIASANNRPVETQTPLGFFYSADDRIIRLNDYLSKHKRIIFDDLRKLQTDTYVKSALTTCQLMIGRLSSAHVEPYTEREQVVLECLQQWNGRYDTHEKAPVLYQMMLYYFTKDNYTKKWGKQFTNRILNSDMINDIVGDELKHPNHSNIVSLNYAFTKTCRKQNKYKDWGDMHHLAFNHLFGNIPVIGKRFRFGDTPIGGSYNSLMKTAHHVSNKRTKASYGADARFISILNDDNANYFVLLGGQDGWIGSPGLTNQVPLWLSGEYIRIPFNWQDVQSTFTYKVEIKP